MHNHHCVAWRFTNFGKDIVELRAVHVIFIHTMIHRGCTEDVTIDILDSLKPYI